MFVLKRKTTYTHTVYENPRIKVEHHDVITQPVARVSRIATTLLQR